MAARTLNLTAKSFTDMTKTDTKEHNNRQNVNICVRNLDTNKERLKVIEHF
jgi:hypothetical protein